MSWSSRAAPLRRAVCASVFSAALVASALLVPHDGVPRVEGGCAFAGDPPRTLVLHDGTRPLRSVRPPPGGRDRRGVPQPAPFPGGPAALAGDARRTGVEMEICRDWGLRTPSPKSTVRDLPCLRVHAVGLAFRRKPEVIASVLRFCDLRISQNA